MPWIENCSMHDIERAFHHDPGANSMVIQIVDPDMEHPKPLYPFKERYLFKFLDIEEEHKHAINPVHAHAIAGLLVRAKQERMNVVVHCVAGICRSGAVVDAAQAFGFDAVDKFRNANTRVRKLIMEALMK